MSTPKHLYKSNEPVIAGVCGGIAEFFAIDPTFVRVIGVVLLLVSFGTFFLFYLAAMVVIPKNPDSQPVAASTATAIPGYPYPRTDTSTAAWQTSSATTATTGDAAAAKAQASYSQQQSQASYSQQQSQASYSPYSQQQPPYPQEYSQPPQEYSQPPQEHSQSPYSQEQSQQPQSQYSQEQSQQPQPPYPQEQPQPAAKPATLKKRWSSAVCVGLLLIGIGVIALLANMVNISFWRLWPLILVVVGIAQLFTPGANGWSLERAGAAIVIISLGILAQALMLGVIRFSAVMVASYRLWPVLLVVIGLMVLAAAKKQQAFSLLASLLFSATLLLGVWLFGGMGDYVTVQLFDGHGFSFIMPTSPIQPDEATERFVYELSSFNPFHLEP